MSASKDPLASAVTRILWPFLKELGFHRVTPRKFAREVNDVFQQLWVDANGVSGKSSTLIVLCANLPFGPVNGYMDPHGFRIVNGKTWNTSTPEAADRAMESIVEALRTTELKRLEPLSSTKDLLEALKSFHRREWYDTYSSLHANWVSGDSEMVATANDNRSKLKL